MEEAWKVACAQIEERDRDVEGGDARDGADSCAETRTELSALSSEAAEDSLHDAGEEEEEEAGAARRQSAPEEEEGGAEWCVSACGEVVEDVS
eukprot:1838991-Rhodomonas_salina.1